MKWLRIASVSSFVIAGWLLLGMAQGPGEITRGGQNLYHTQEAHDAVQDRDIEELQEWRKAETVLMQDVRDKQTYQIGGLAGFGALLVWLQIWQLKKMKP